MLRTVGKTLGGALALLCLASTLEIAQGQTMICTRDTGMGTCVAATGPDGKTLVVVGQGLKTGEKMDCQDRGYMINCEPIVTK
jgi:hypothetical protein